MNIIEKIFIEQAKALKIQPDADGKGFENILPNVIYLNMADYRELCKSVPPRADNSKLDEIIGMKIIKRAGEMECAFDETEPDVLHAPPAGDIMTADTLKKFWQSISEKSEVADEMNLELLAKQYFESAKKSDKEFLDSFKQNVLKPELETIGLTLANDGVIQKTGNSVTMKREFSVDEIERINKYFQDSAEAEKRHLDLLSKRHKRFYHAHESDRIAPKHWSNIECLIMMLEWALEVVEKFIDGELPRDGVVPPELKSEYERAKMFFDAAKLTYFAHK